MESARQQAEFDLGNEIRQLRKVRGMTLQQLALAATLGYRPAGCVIGTWCAHRLVLP